MAIEQVMLEGDFIIRGATGKTAFRFSLHKDVSLFEIRAFQNHILMSNVEILELIGWLQRRLDEPLEEKK